MNFLNFSKGIKDIKKGNIRYYYLEYENNIDDINKKFSFFIGAISLTSPPGNEFECPTVHCLDANGKQCIKTYGYYTFINCDIKVLRQYNILGESQGDHIKSYISSLIKGEASLKPLKDNGTYVNVKLARTRLFKDFWDMNKDWMHKITGLVRIPKQKRKSEPKPFHHDLRIRWSSDKSEGSLVGQKVIDRINSTNWIKDKEYEVSDGYNIEYTGDNDDRIVFSMGKEFLTKYYIKGQFKHISKKVEDYIYKYFYYK